MTVLSFTPTPAPLSTMLSNRFGYRPVVMVGGFFISLGTITSAFTNSINEMYITVGIISGAYETHITTPISSSILYLSIHLSIFASHSNMPFTELLFCSCRCVCLV